MAIETYTTVDKLKSYLSIGRSTDDEVMQWAVDTASKKVDALCKRRFWVDDSASVRKFVPSTGDEVWIDDASSISTVQVDDDGDGVADTTISSYQSWPTNSVVNGIDGWPTVRLLRWPTGTSWPIIAAGDTIVPTVHVNATWGWTAVPEAVSQACLIIAGELFRLKDAPLGITDAIGEFGALRPGSATEARAMTLLAPYRKSPVAV